VRAFNAETWPKSGVENLAKPQVSEDQLEKYAGNQMSPYLTRNAWAVPSIRRTSWPVCQEPAAPLMRCRSRSA